MKFLPLVHGAALSAIFLVGGCGASGSNDLSAAPTGAAPTGAAAKAAGTDAARADIPRLPDTPDDVPDAAVEPLNDAGEIASEIASNTSIARVPTEGGLAWVQDGDVVRTASRDGRRVSYFHPGENRPFLVQEGQQAYALDQGRARLAYDSAGRPAPVSDTARAKAERLAEEARRQRDAAEGAARHADRDI